MTSKTVLMIKVKLIFDAEANGGGAGAVPKRNNWTETKVTKTTFEKKRKSAWILTFSVTMLEIW